MASKTTSKTAAKPAARKSASASKTAAPKSKVAPKKKESEVKPPSRPQTTAPSPSAKTSPAAKPAAPAAPPTPPSLAKKAVAIVSLIDKQPSHKKAGDGEPKKKTTVLPPISRIRASLETPPAPPQPPPPPEPPKVEAAPESSTAAGEEPAVETEDGKRIIHIKPRIIVKQLAAELGVKPHQLIAELMGFN